MLLTGPLHAVVLKNELKGITVLNEDADDVWVKAEGGEVWHDLVLYCVNKGYAGIENLSLIPEPLVLPLFRISVLMAWS